MYLLLSIKMRVVKKSYSNQKCRRRADDVCCYLTRFVRLLYKTYNTTNRCVHLINIVQNTIVTSREAKRERFARASRFALRFYLDYIVFPPLPRSAGVCSVCTKHRVDCCHNNHGSFQQQEQPYKGSSQQHAAERRFTKKVFASTFHDRQK